MKLYGFTKTTLLDYPGKIAATIFLGGCNFRCPFCHNSSLILPSDTQPSLISFDEILTFLKKRRNILEGVCISGGEPTLSLKLPELLSQIKALGYPIKLDTNGSQPQILKALAEKDLIDKIAMDIKSSPENYSKLIGLPAFDLTPIQESVEFLKASTIEYEFRTTVVRELHTEADFLSIRSWLSGASSYYLQAYKDSASVLSPGFHSYSRLELEHFQDLLLTAIPHVEIRGID